MRSALLFVLLILHSPLQSLAGYDCTCPGPDKILAANRKLHPSCGKIPRPAEAEKNIFVHGCQSGLVSPQSMIAETLDRIDPGKNPDELLDEMSCLRDVPHENNSPLFCHFRKTLAPLIKLAADQAMVPFAVEACLFKQESQFDPDAVSPVGAQGYVQFMNNKKTGNITAHQVDHCIQHTSAWFLGRKMAFEGELDVQRTELSRLIKSHAAKKLIQKRQKEINMNGALLEQTIITEKAKKVWDLYWKGTEGAPKHFTPEMVHCPQAAFIGSMVKQILDVAALIGPEEKDQSGDPQPPRFSKIMQYTPRQRALLIAGAYNMGVSGFAEACGKLNGGTPTLEECISAIENDETKNHIRKISKCSEKGHDKTCKGLQCDRR